MAPRKNPTSLQEERYGPSSAKKERHGETFELYNKDITESNSDLKKDGQRGKRYRQHQGAFQGRPLSDQLFTIYFDAMINDYDNALPDEIKQTQPDTYERSEFEGRKTTNIIWKKRI